MEYYVHPTAVIDEQVSIGSGTRIWHWVHVSPGVRIGNRCSLGQNVFVGKGVAIGHNVKIQNNVSVYEGVILEDDVFCGPSMVFTNVINPRSHIERKHEFRATRVGKGATLGANCTILCGNDIGDYAMVGAGTVVTKSVPAHAVIVGNPGRRIGWVCQCGVPLPKVIGESHCASCSAGYRLGPNECSPLTASVSKH